MMNRLLLSLCAVSGLMLGPPGGASQVQGNVEQRAGMLPSTSDDDLKGEIRTIEFESKHLGESREIKVYLPPGHDPKKKYPVIYTPDGFIAVKCENLEPLITSGKVPPFIIIGTASGPGGMRQLEYCPGWDPDQPEHFEKHEKFFIEEVIPWAEKEFGASKKRKQRAIYGSSNGAPFALTMANRYPKLFGHVFAFMVYGLKFDIFESELKAQTKNPTRYILVTGADDAHGVESNQKVEQLLKEKKFPVASAIIEGFGHSSALEYQELTPCVEATFGKNKKYQPIGRSVDPTAEKPSSEESEKTAPPEQSDTRQVKKKPNTEADVAKAIQKLRGQIQMQGKSVVAVQFANVSLTDAQLKELLPGLKELKKLQFLAMVNCAKLTDESLKELPNELKDLKSLQTLYIGGTKVTDAGLKDFKELKGLQDLGLGRTKVTDAGLKELKHLKKLQKLWLANTKVTDEGLRELKEMKKLREVVIADCPKITRAGVSDLKKALPKLVFSGRDELLLSEAESAAYEAVRKSGGQTQIQGTSVAAVQFNRKSLNDAKLKELSQGLKEFKKLRVLLLSGTGITDAGLKEIKDLKGLQQLALANTKVTDEGLKELKEMKKLRQLDITKCSMVTRAGLDELKKALPQLKVAGREELQMPEAEAAAYLAVKKQGAQVDIKSHAVTELKFNRSSFDDAKLKELSKDLKEFKKLRSLSLNGSGITDAGLVELKELKGVKQLALGRTKVTDAGLKELKEMQELRQLDITSCSNITRSGLEDLKKALPQLRIAGREDLQMPEAEAAAYLTLKKYGARINLQGKSVASVQINRTSMDDAKMKELLKDFKELKKLKTLTLAGCKKVTDESLKELPKELNDLKQLRALVLTGTGITDAGLKELKEMKGLQQLGLGRTQVTDEGLKEIKEMKKLRQLDLSGCSKVTQTGIDDLKKALPKLQIKK